MKIQHVAPEWVHATWPQVVPFLKPALVHARGECSIDHAQAMVSSGQWLLVVAVDDAGVVHGGAMVELFNRPTARVAFVVAIGGRLVSSRESLAQLAALLRTFGATVLEGAVRESVARLWRRYGLTEKYRVVGVAL